MIQNIRESGYYTRDAFFIKTSSVSTLGKMNESEISELISRLGICNNCGIVIGLWHMVLRRELISLARGIRGEYTRTHQVLSERKRERERERERDPDTVVELF